MIVFPILGDQDFNGMRIEEVGAGIKLEIGKVTGAQLKAAMEQVLYNKEFRDRVKQVSNMFSDSQTKPIDTAVWWVEYVLRHEDLRHLKPRGRHQNWYERFFLDVWFVIFIGVEVGVILVLGMIVVMVRRWLRWFSNRGYKDTDTNAINGSAGVGDINGYQHTSTNVKYKVS